MRYGEYSLHKIVVYSLCLTTFFLCDNMSYMYVHFVLAKRKSLRRDLIWDQSVFNLQFYKEYKITFQNDALQFQGFYTFGGIVALNDLRWHNRCTLFAQNNTCKIALDYETVRDDTTFLMHHFRSRDPYISASRSWFLVARSWTANLNLASAHTLWDSSSDSAMSKIALRRSALGRCCNWPRFRLIYQWTVSRKYIPWQLRADFARPTKIAAIALLRIDIDARIDNAYFAHWYIIPVLPTVTRKAPRSCATLVICVTLDILAKFMPDKSPSRQNCTKHADSSTDDCEGAEIYLATRNILQTVCEDNIIVLTDFSSIITLIA